MFIKPKKISLQIVSIISALFVLVSMMSVIPQKQASAASAITLCGGWYEEAFAEWNSSSIGSNVKVSYAVSGSSSYTAVDSELIRSNRVDIPGLKGNTKYDIKIEGSSGSASCTVTTMKFDRSGYAHYNYTSGVGAYKDDGTLKSGVTVIYVTNSNKNSITYGGKTGLYNIFYSAKPKNVVFRFIGTIDVPSGAKANDGKQNDGSSMLYLQYGENVTIEGIGYNANLNKWGFEMKRCTSCEVRNLWLGQYPDDGISMTGDSSNKSTRMWVHNNTIEKGYNAYAGNGTVDDDKADGDGSADIKWSEYVTISYNVFKNCHKTSLVGGGPTQYQDWITYHHNWFNNTESRNPRARNAHIHSYNNYFTTNKQYGLGASYNSKIFSEANYFEGTYLPLDAVNMGSDAYSGTIKSYNDKFDNCTMGSGLAYKIVTSRTAKASISNLKSGGDAYDNFDLSMYSYTPQTADSAKTEVKNYAGRMQQKEYGSSSSSDTPQTETIVAATFTEGAAFTIKNVNSGLYMEVAGNNASNSANVQQWDLNGGETTATNIPDVWNTWRLFSAGDGYYYIISEVGDGATYALDVTGKKSDNGTNIEIYKYSGADNQKFKLTKNSDGSYKIRTKVSGDKSAVEVVNASLEYGANVQEWEVNGANCQDWILESAENPGIAMDTSVVYTFSNVNSGLVMEVKDGKMADAQNVQQWEKNGADCQKWILKKFNDTSNYYYIRSYQDPTYVLLANGGENGSNIELVTYSTSNSSMLFKFARNLDGSYSIMTRSSKDARLVEVSGASKTGGANIQQYDPNGNICQEWNAATETTTTTTKATATTTKATTTTTTTTKATTATTTTTKTTTTTTTTTAAATTVTTPVTTTSATAAPQEDVIYGDSNNDGKVTLADAVAILQYIANKDKYQISSEGLVNCDVYDRGDGITAMDALAIQQFDAGVVSSLPVSYK